MGTSWNRIGVLILLVLCSSYGVTVKTDSLQVRQNAQVDGKLKVGNTPKPVATDSVLTKLPDGTIGLWPISAISTDTSFTDSSLWADSSRASYKSDTTAGAMRLGGKTLSQIDTIGHGAIKQSIRDTASNKLWIHGKADSCVLADSVKKIPPVAFSDSSRAAYKADTSAGALRLGGKTKAYYDTVGAGWTRDSLANKLCLHCVADSAGGAARLGGKTLSQIDTMGHGAIKKSIIDTAANKLSLHGTADSANGSKYLGGKTKAYYDTVGNGGMNAAIALKLNISDTSIFSRDGHGHDTGDLSGLPNFDYFVQGSSSKRTTDAGDTDVNSYSQSGFYRPLNTAPNLPTATAYGIIHTNYTSNQHAFQLASRWYGNQLFYRTKSDGTWRPWVELYHTGNFDPATKSDTGHTQVISTITGLSDSLTAHRTAITKSDTAGHGAIKKSIIDTAANKLSLHGTADSANGSKYLGGKTKAYYDTVGNGGMNAAIALKLNISDTSIFSRDGHGHDTGDLSGLPNFDYFVQGSSSTRTTEALATDLNTYLQSGFYRATATAPNLPTVATGYGIIHTNYLSNQYAFQLASQWKSNNLYYRVKNNDTEWRPWVELYHSGNFDPADYTTTAQLQDWSTNIMADQLGSYNTAEFTTVYNDYCDNIRLIKKGLTSLQNGYAGSIAFGARGANTRHAAIAAKQTGSDANQVGLAFFTHSKTSISTTYPMVEKMVLDHNGTLSVGGNLIVGDKLTLAVDGSGHATVSTKEYGDDIKIKTGGNGSVIDMKDLSTSISSRDVTVSSSYQTKVKSSGTVNIEGGSGITLDGDTVTVSGDLIVNGGSGVGRLKLTNNSGVGEIFFGDSSIYAAHIVGYTSGTGAGKRGYMWIHPGWQGSLVEIDQSVLFSTRIRGRVIYDNLESIFSQLDPYPNEINLSGISTDIVVNVNNCSIYKLTGLASCSRKMILSTDWAVDGQRVIITREVGSTPLCANVWYGRVKSGAPADSGTVNIPPGQAREFLYSKSYGGWLLLGGKD